MRNGKAPKMYRKNIELWVLTVEIGQGGVENKVFKMSIKENAWYVMMMTNNRFLENIRLRRALFYLWWVS